MCVVNQYDGPSGSVAIPLYKIMCDKCIYRIDRWQSLTQGGDPVPVHYWFYFLYKIVPLVLACRLQQGCFMNSMRLDVARVRGVVYTATLNLSKLIMFS